jgi:hypothetical protein
VGIVRQVKAGIMLYGKFPALPCSVIEEDLEVASMTAGFYACKGGMLFNS